ncbi:sec-independent protein translocase protein TATB, chloroplastic [Pyrus x bretschneideri]|uniref:sec-independent protein translocase protein TATB, chloroplastic n=1 Tax=Pyrus x bretschneideri TaxID=225117 RepID=UPI0005109F98|nr:sec-independent protein translocase protein TATB, chloroplastic [Pyrus x bretschneideri]
MAMASIVAAAPTTFVCSSSSAARGTKAAAFRRKDPKFQLCSVVPPLGLSPFSPWTGLKHLGVSFAPKSLKLERKRRCKGMVVYASLFGVGAPEALVIGVVALLVFGPKGLAEVARTLGKTLRAFQPTIKELQEVSRDFKSTLEKEIGLDDISSSTIDAFNGKKMDTTSTPSSTTMTEDSKTTIEDSKTTDEDSKTPDISSLSSIDAYNARIMSKNSTSSSTATADPNGVPSPPRAYTAEEYLKITEEQLAAAQKKAQVSAPAESQVEPQTPSQDTAEETAAKTPSPQPPQTVEETAAGTPSPQQPQSET